MTAAAKAALAAILFVAFALRVFGLQYGLPSVYNPDEVAIMARALSFAKGTLNPHNFLYPTFYFYVLFAWVGSYLGIVWLTGGVASVTALQEMYFTNPTGIYTAGRLLTAVCGTACVFLVYRLARGLFDQTAAFAAAAFLAVAPLAVRDSHYVKHDIPATLAVLVAVMAITRVWPRLPDPGKGRHDALAAGGACGVAFATHYYCIFLVLPLVWACFQRWRGAGRHVVARHLFAAAVASAFVFFVLSPFVLFEPITAWRDIAANRQIVVDRAITSGAFGPLARYLEILWTDSMGKPVIALAAAGAVLLAAASPARALLLLLFPVGFFLFISNTAPASRYLNPILPFIALLAGSGLSHLAVRLRAPRAAIAVAIAALTASPLAASIATGQFFRTDDTRAIAERLIEEKIPAGATILLQPYSVSLSPSRAGLVEALTRHLGSPDAASTKFQLQLGLDPYPAPSYRLIYLGRGGLDVDKIYVDPAELGSGSDLAALRRLGVTYVVFKRYNNGDSETSSFLAELARRGRLIAVVSPYRPHVPEGERSRIAPFLHNTDTRIDEALERPGPPLEIWQLDGPDP